MASPPMAAALHYVPIILVLAAACSHLALASDPDITTDYVPAGILNPAFFTFTGLRSVLPCGAASAPPPSKYKLSKATELEFPALTGQGVSMAVLQYGALDGINPLHIHPRAAELLLVLQGSLDVGFVDSSNNLFKQTLQTGDMFVFPKGLPHYQINRDVRTPAVAVSAFGSANAGTVRLPKALFGSGIEWGVLAKSFNTDDQTVAKLVAAASMG